MDKATIDEMNRTVIAEFRATARALEGAERDEVYANSVAVEPQFGEYQSNTTRVIPVVELVRAG